MASASPTFRVFLSSTMDDLTEERDAAMHAIEIINDMFHKIAGVIGVRAEAFAARSDAPEEVCLESARSCDVYIGIFDRRWGYMPPDDNPDGLSATAMEYEAAVAAGRHRLVLVSTSQDREPELKAWLDAKTEWGTGVFRRKYDNRHELMLWVIASVARILLQRPEAAMHRAKLQAYLKDPRVDLAHGVVDRLQYLRFNWISQLRHVLTNLSIEDVYVGLKAVPNVPDGDLPDEDALESAQQDIDPLHINIPSYLRRTRPQRSASHQFSAPVDLDAAANQGRISVILGAPGGGKSTFLRRTAIREARAGRLPIYVELRTYARRLIGDDPDRVRISLEQHVRQQLQADFRCTVDDETFACWLASEDCTLLLDGLDEVPQAFWRQQVALEVEALAKRVLPHGRVLVTSRIVGYRDAPLYGDVDHYTIQPLDGDAIRVFVGAWFYATDARPRGGSEAACEEAQASADQLLGDIGKTPEVARLARNPLMLTILALLQRQGHRIPQRRIELYEKCTEVLVESIDAARFEPDEVPVPGDLSGMEMRYLLQPLAYRLHSREDGIVGRKEILALLRDELEDQHGVDRPQATTLAKKLLQYIRERPSLLVERGADQFGFPHLSFEEYFAAVHVVEQADQEQSFQDHLLPRIHDPRWREVIRLAAGHLSPQQAERFIQRVADADQAYNDPAETHHVIQRSLRLALACLADDPTVRTPFRKTIIQRVQAWLQSEPEAALQILREAGGELTGSSVANDLSPILLVMAHDKSFNHRSEALNAIASLEPDDGLQTATRLLTDPNANVRMAAVEAVGALGSDGDLPAIKALLDDPSAHVRTAAVTVLRTLGWDADLPAIKALLDDPNANVRTAAVTVLRALGWDADLPAIKALLDDPSAHVRTAVVAALRALGSDADLPAIKTLLDDPSAHVRMTVVAALRALGSDADLPAIKTLLDDPNANVRTTALTALRTLGSDADLPAIKTLLDDPRPEVRAAAVTAMGALGSAQDLPAIVSLLSDSTLHERISAIRVADVLWSRWDTHPNALARVPVTSPTAR